MSVQFVVYSKYLTHTQSNNTSESTILLTPISPESENSTYNESYVKIQNEKNESLVADDYESMDETDFPPPLPELKSIALTKIDFKSSQSSLQKVFCCGSSGENISTSVRLSRPGSAVKIMPIKVIDDNNKVGESEKYESVVSVLTPSEDDFGTSDNAQTLSPISPAQFNITSPKIEDSDSEHSLSAPKAHGRFSPKTYDEMIKFVFTEHGIRVISDKEYVV
jgi:hypothetical protein